MPGSTGTRRQNRRARALLVVAVIAALVGGVIGGLIAHAVEGTPKASNATPTITGSGTSCNATQIADTTLASVVTINARGASGSGSTGSGEVIDTSGHILTNNHVISVAATTGGSVQVVFSDGQTAPATIVGRDPQTDLAVLKASATHSLTPITLGTSESLQVGQPVVALGAPLGLSNTVTSGIVSALGRTIQVEGEADKKALLLGAIQTDTSINPGNSGGALVDCSGQLVGIPSAEASVPGESGGSSVGSVGLGFAIPIDLAKTISAELISSGKVTHSYIGLSAAVVDASAAQSAGLPEGLYVSQVDPSGPAAVAGIQAGDVITAVGGQKATTTEQLTALTLTQKPGSKLAVSFSRSGTSRSVTVTLTAQP